MPAQHHRGAPALKDGEASPFVSAAHRKGQIRSSQEAKRTAGDWKKQDAEVDKAKKGAKTAAHKDKLDDIKYKKAQEKEQKKKTAYLVEVDIFEGPKPEDTVGVKANWIKAFKTSLKPALNAEGQSISDKATNSVNDLLLAGDTPEVTEANANELVNDYMAQMRQTRVYTAKTLPTGGKPLPKWTPLKKATGGGKGESKDKKQDKDKKSGKDKKQDKDKKSGKDKDGKKEKKSKGKGGATD